MTNQLLKLLGLFTLVSGLGIGGCLSGGCAAPKDQQAADMQHQQFANYVGVLKDANFKGHIGFEAGGSPLSVGMKTVWFLGAENTKMECSGDVDFTKPNASRSGAIPQPGD